MNKSLTVGKLYALRRMESGPRLFVELRSFDKLDTFEPAKYLKQEDVFLVLYSKETEKGISLIKILLEENIYQFFLYHEEMPTRHYLEIE